MKPDGLSLRRAKRGRAPHEAKELVGPTGSLGWAWVLLGDSSSLAVSRQPDVKRETTYLPYAAGVKGTSRHRHMRVSPYASPYFRTSNTNFPFLLPMR